MKLGVLFSGGKDSVFSAWLAEKRGHELSCLISIMSANKDSYMYHPISKNVITKQAEVMELPLLLKESKGKKEKELIDLKRALDEAKIKYEIEGVCVGAIASSYQYERVKKICKELDLGVFSPIWGWGEEEYMHQLVKNDFDAIIVKVAADGLDEKWLGKKIDLNLLKDAKQKKIHIAGEGGEYESLVLDCGLFKKKLKILNSEKKMDTKISGFLVIKKVGIVQK
jgi:asparagine synthase (glutamine-hydrolysing)